MKKIIASMALLAGGAFLASVSAETITSLDKLSSHAVYTLTRQATLANGGGLLHAVEGSNLIASTQNGKGITPESPEAQWSIHYSPAERAYFIYNLATGTFAGGNGKGRAVLSETPADTRLILHDGPKYWAIDCAGQMLGLAKDDAGTALFLDDLGRTEARRMACFFSITSTGATISHERYEEIERKIAEGRESAFSKYTKFITQAEKMAASTNASYQKCLGVYDITELKDALANSDRYTMAQIEEIYQRTLLTRYPQAGHFYRVHHDQRPTSKFINNTLRTTESGQLVGAEFNAFAFGTATEGFSDDLCLVRFWPQDGDLTKVKVEIPAFGVFLGQADNAAAPHQTTEPSEATVFDLDTKSITQRTFILAQPNKGNWLTMGGDNTLQAWNVNEPSMYFYLEEAKTIDVTVDANGYASVCVPCGVTIPEGCKAYTVTSVAGGKAFVEEISGPIHQRTPFILKAAQGATTVSLPIENNLNWIATEMAGAVRVMEAPGRYVPEYSASGISFRYVAATDPVEKVAPGSIYIISDDNGPLTTVMGANPEASIEEITVDDAAGRELFDLQGRRVVDTPRAGLYINAATKRVVRVK